MTETEREEKLIAARQRHEKPFACNIPMRRPTPTQPTEAPIDNNNVCSINRGKKEKQ